MDPWFQNGTLITGWNPDSRMESWFLYDGTLIPGWNSDSRMELWLQNGTLISKTLIPGTLIPGTLFPGTMIPRTMILRTLIPGTLILRTLIPGTLLIPRTLIPGTLIPGFQSIANQSEVKHKKEQKVGKADFCENTLSFSGSLLPLKEAVRPYSSLVEFLISLKEWKTATHFFT